MSNAEVETDHPASRPILDFPLAGFLVTVSHLSAFGLTIGTITDRASPLSNLLEIADKNEYV